MSHAPIPWEYGDCFHPQILIVAQDGTRVASIYPDGKGVGRANAEFITRACNCHDELLDVCLSFAKRHGNLMVNGTMFDDIAAKATAVLAKLGLEVK